MAGCCGGKNAGRPIGKARYIMGLAFFTGYHGAVHAALSGVSLVSRQMVPVRDFHTRYFRHLFAEAIKRDGILVGDSTAPERCAIDEA
jgi:hypothetical protein